MSEESSTATETTPSQDATTTDGGAAVVDTQPAPDPKTETPAPQPPAAPESLLKPPTEPEGPPDQYEVTVPTGMPEEWQFDPEVEGALKGAWREMGLTQPNAQKLIDQVWPVMQRRQQEQAVAKQLEWIEAAKSHPDYGGVDFEKNRGIAQNAIEKLGSAGLIAQMNDPIFSHPDVFHFVWKVGKLLSEDGFVSGEAPGKTVDPNDRAAVAKAFYGDADV